MKHIEEQPKEKPKRYSAIDRHNDFIAQGYQTKHKAPFIGRVVQIVLTPLAKAILEKNAQVDSSSLTTE